MPDSTWPRKNTSRQVLGLLNELDPYGLDPGLRDGAPADEYASEAEFIARHLINGGAITADQVDAIWLEWFDEPLTKVIGAKAIEQFVANLIGLTAPKTSWGDTP